MPFLSEHSCRMMDPSLFKKGEDNWGRVSRRSKSNKKRYFVVRGKLKSTNKWADQSFRYPVSAWSKSDARKHCTSHKGKLFEAAKEKKKEKSMDELITYGVIHDMEIRNINKEERTVEFVAATESGVDTWMGREFLDMDGLDLKRFKGNPQILNTHKRDDIKEIVGRGQKAFTENRKLVIKTRFTDVTESGQLAWDLIQDNMLQTVSVGFKSWVREEIDDQGSAKLGSKTIQGPAVIIRQWELFELSVVPVPADAEAIKRGLEDMSLKDARIMINELNKFIKNKERNMDDETKKENEDLQNDGDGEQDPAKPEGTEEKTDATGETSKEKPGDDGERSAPAPVVSESEVEQCKRDIKAITPEGYEEFANRCLMQGLSVEQTRAALLTENAARLKPAGVTEPVKVEPEEEKKEKKEEDDSTREPEKLEKKDFVG